MAWLETGLPQTGKTRADAFQDELDRILKHPAFPKRGALPLILSYLVKKSLAGEPDQIKGYTILVDALGRGGQVDAQSEASLRVQMKRLRDALANVYRDTPADHPTRIDFQAGSYVPVLIDRSQTPESPAMGPKSAPPAYLLSQPARNQWRFALIIFCVGFLGFFVGLATDYVYWHKPAVEQGSSKGSSPRSWRPEIGIALVDFGEDGRSVHQSLVFSLSRSELFRVNPEMKQTDATRPASALPAFLLTITNRNDPLSDLVQIENVQTGEVIYSGTINHQNRGLEGIEQIAWLVMSNSSPIIAYLNRHPPDAMGSFRCALATMTYFQTYQDRDFDALRGCIAEFKDRRLPDALLESAAGWYQMARYWRHDNPEESLSEAWSHAVRASELSPMSARAHYLKSIVLSAQGDLENALQVGRLAYDLNPLDETTTTGLGVRLLGMGKWQEASAMLRSVYRRAPSPPVWLTFNVATAEIMASDPVLLGEVFPLLLSSKSHVSAAVSLAVANVLGDETRKMQAMKRIQNFGTLEDAIKAVDFYYKNKQIVNVLVDLMKR